MSFCESSGPHENASWSFFSVCFTHSWQKCWQVNLYKWITIGELQHCDKPSCFTYYPNGNTPESSTRLLRVAEADRSTEDNRATLGPNSQLHVITSKFRGYTVWLCHGGESQFKCSNMFINTTPSNVLKHCNLMMYVLQNVTDKKELCSLPPFCLLLS